MPEPGSLSAWLAHFESLDVSRIQLGLERVARVREALGLGFVCPLITVAGTNGKGSACAMLRAILAAAGYRVGVYTSPHLVRYNERVSIADREADDRALAESFAAVESARGDVPLTYFEFGTLAAAWLFNRARLDAIVLEVGLGGRFDAVNVFDPDCALVMSIDLDHQHYLGDTREQIGFEKAGIFRAGRPAVCADPDPPVSLIDHAHLIGADLRLAGRDFRWVGAPGGFAFSGRSRWLDDLPAPALAGDFQVDNAAGVLAALESVGARLPVSVEAIRQGLANVRLRGRFEVFADTPQVVLDVAHNPQAVRALVATLRARPVPGRTVAVFGALADKDLAGIVTAAGGEIESWYLAPLPTPRSAAVAELGKLIESQWPGRRVRRAESVAAALCMARDEVNGDDRILIFGSFYTVGEALREQARNGDPLDRGGS